MTARRIPRSPSGGGRRRRRGRGPSQPTRGTVLQIGPSERNGHHPAVFFRSTAFGKLISFSGEPADLVLIDTPALLGVSEAVTIADHADAILLVVNRGTSLADLRRARERLAFTDTPLIGYLLNRGFAQRAYAGSGGAGRGRSPAACCAAGARENVHNRRGPVDLRRLTSPRERPAAPARHREREWLVFVSPLSWRSTTAGP